MIELNTRHQLHTAHTHNLHLNFHLHICHTHASTALHYCTAMGPSHAASPSLAQRTASLSHLSSSSPRSTINNLPVGRNVDETLRVLQGYQYVAANPDEVCPANWTPGEKTMKEDPVGSKEYFSAIG